MTTIDRYKLQTILFLTGLAAFPLAGLIGSKACAADQVDAAVQVASFETASTSSETVKVSADQIEAELESLKSSGIPGESAAAIEGRLKKSLQHLQAIAEQERASQQLELQIAQIPKATETLQERKRAIQQDQTPVELKGKNLSEMEDQLQEAKSRLREADEAEDNATKTSEERLSRIDAIQKELTSLRRKLSEPPPSDFQSEADLETRSLAIESITRRQLTSAKIRRQQYELEYLQEANEFLALSAEFESLNAARLQVVAESWEKQLEAFRRRETNRQAAITKKIAKQTHPRLKPVAEENNRIAAIRQQLAHDIESVSRQLKELESLSESFGDDFVELQQKVDFAGTSSSTGIMLRKMRGELPSSEDMRRRDEFVATETPKIHLRLIEWKKQVKTIVDSDAVSESMRRELNAIEAKLPSISDADLPALKQLLEDRKILLQSAIADHESYLRLLNRLDLQGRALREQVESARVYLDQRVLWMRSHERLKLADFGNAFVSFGSLFSLTAWSQVATTLAGGLTSTWYGVLAVGAIVVFLIRFQSRMEEWQDKLIRLPSKSKARISKSFLAVSLNLVTSAHWPILLLAVGYRLHIASEDPWGAAVGRGCMLVVPLVWGCEFLRALGRREGVGEKMFGWPTEATFELRRTIVSVLFVGTPLYVLMTIARAFEFTERDSLSRILFLVLLSWWAIQIWRLLRPSGKFMRSIVGFERETGGTFLYRHRRVLCVFMTAAPAVFAAISVWGYHESARQLLGRLVESGGVIVATLIAYFLADRSATVINHNRLVDRARNKAREEAATPAISEKPDRSVSQSIDNARLDSAPGQERDLPIAELRSLFRFAMLSVLATSGWFIWSEVLPALHVLDQFVVWNRVIEVREMVTSADGSSALQTVEQLSPTTLTHVFLAVMVIAGTITLGRRLPAFLEVFVLERLPFDHGGRQATKILAGYAVNLTGLLIACNLLSLSWSSVQWLAAAMTVGLGFGLQEIFGNLVSGLIILFERPIRVGDVVTVGDTTGTITRMQMRATTITDYDRRELIVPNKKFITDNVVNWTLSDPISRMVIRVGVAYGTDVQRVQEILMDIARKNPLVMGEPAPGTLFKGFGDSTLDFELRVFIPNRDVFIEVHNQLNAAIAREFSSQGIEIAFPQMDLHIRTNSPNQRPRRVKRPRCSDESVSANRAA